MKTVSFPRISFDPRIRGALCGRAHSACACGRAYPGRDCVFSRRRPVLWKGGDLSLRVDSGVVSSNFGTGESTCGRRTSLSW